MKQSLLEKWCGQAWLHATYLLGIIMLNVLILKWQDWETPQRIMCLLAVFLPAHVFEELTWPNGFYYMMNKLIQKSDNPLAYPENRLTDMITNFGVEVLLIIATFLMPVLGGKALVFIIFFGCGETLVHTIFSIKTYRYYKSKGKRTLYSPGLITAWCMLLELSVASIGWFIQSGSFAVSDLWGLLGVACMIVFMIRLPFIISNRHKSTRYAYTSKGYFEKFGPESD